MTIQYVWMAHAQTTVTVGEFATLILLAVPSVHASQITLVRQIAQNWLAVKEFHWRAKLIHQIELM